MSELFKEQQNERLLEKAYDRISALEAELRKAVKNLNKSHNEQKGYCDKPYCSTLKAIESAQRVLGENK